MQHAVCEAAEEQAAGEGLILCVGQGAWEDVLKESTSRIKGVLDAKGIHAWVDFWGYDVDHDWGWWYKQVVYYLPFLLGKR